MKKKTKRILLAILLWPITIPVGFVIGLMCSAVYLISAISFIFTGNSNPHNGYGEW